MSKSEQLLARRAAVVAPGVGRLNTATAASGKGALFVDADGREVIDFAGGIGTLNIGHCHPAIVEAIRRQSEQLIHACFHVATYEPYVALCETLVGLLPHGGPTKALLVNTGAEAVENAVKIARQVTGRAGILCFTEAFHGRTLLGMSLTSKVALKRGCGPFAPEIYRLPYPNFFRYGDGLSASAFVERELARLRAALVNVVAPTQLAAVILEPVQGEGGFVVVPQDYLSGLRQLCDEHGILLILDEVQTGFCRTARWGAFEHFGVVPDLSTWAKSMAGGMPIGAVLGKAEVLDRTLPGTLGGTFGGNPVACAAALATIKAMQELKLNERAAMIGERVRSRLVALQARCPQLADVRGLGAMIAAEFVLDKHPERPATPLVAKVIEGCLARGLLVLATGAHSNIIRLLAPLVISDEHLDRGLQILEDEILKAAA